MCMRALNHSYASERDLSLSFSFSLSLLLSFSLSAVVRRSTRELETQLATAVRGRAALDREHSLSVVGNLGPRVGVWRLEHRSEEFIQTGPASAQGPRVGRVTARQRKKNALLCRGELRDPRRLCNLEGPSVHVNVLRRVPVEQPTSFVVRVGPRQRAVQCGLREDEKITGLHRWVDYRRDWAVACTLNDIARYWIVCLMRACGARMHTRRPKPHAAHSFIIMLRLTHSQLCYGRHQRRRLTGDKSNPAVSFLDVAKDVDAV